MKITEKQLSRIIQEAFEESRNISNVPYPVATSVSNPDPNTPFANGPGYKRKVGGEQITKKDQLRRTIFNIIENLEGMCQSYTLEDIVNDVAPRYKVDPNVVREIAKKCISTKDKAGEIYYYEGEGEAGDREYKKVMESVRLNESQMRKVVREAIEQILSESVLKEHGNINEISNYLLGQAASKAYKDMHTNFNDTKLVRKRQKQANNFYSELHRRDNEERESICPSVPEEELQNLPAGYFVVLDGVGRNPVSADFMERYSGHAGTEEQCNNYIKKFYDRNANWEYLPSILPVEKYLKNKERYR